MNIYLEIKEIGTQKVIKRYNLTGKSDRMIDKFEDGLNINLNHQLFYTSINKTKLEYEII